MKLEREAVAEVAASGCQGHQACRACRDARTSGRRSAEGAGDTGDAGTRSFFARVRVPGKVLVKKPTSACSRRRPDRPGKIARPFYLAIYVDGTESNGARRPFSHALVGEMTSIFRKTRTRHLFDRPRHPPARTRRLFDHRAAPPGRSSTHSASVRPPARAPVRIRRAFRRPRRPQPARVPGPHGRPARGPTPRGRPRAGARLCARARRSRRAGRPGRRLSACRVPSA